MTPLRRSFALIAMLALAPVPSWAQQIDSSMYSEMRWRMIGPVSRQPHQGRRRDSRPAQRVLHRRRRRRRVEDRPTTAARGIRSSTTQPSGSIGAIAVAPSNPNIIYVGSGEGLQRPDLSTGDGIYKSTDAGKTWTHLGLRDGQQIPQIVVDPRDPNRLFVAVMGHPYGPNAERGLFRSTDGGATFQKVLYKDENTGAIDVVLDPVDPNIVYCALWEARQGPWENGQFSGPGSGLFKSTDGGDDLEEDRQGAADVRAGRTRPHRHHRGAEHAVANVRDRRRGARRRTLSIGRRRRDTGTRRRPTRASRRANPTSPR